MKLLIIVPTLNSWLLLQKLINSLERQTFKNWRVVFVDGKSDLKHKKNLYLLCKNKKNFSLINQTNDLGIFGAMNEGIQKAKKDEWILFWGSDDWCFNKNSLENLFKRIKIINKKIKKIDLVICKAKYKNIYTNKTTRISSFKNIKKDMLIDEDVFKKELKNGLIPAHQGVLFGPSLIEKGLRYDENFSIAGDLDYFLRISNINKVNILCLNLFLVCMGNSGLSSKSIKRKFIEVIRAYKKVNTKSFWIIIIRRYLNKIKELL